MLGWQEGGSCGHSSRGCRSDRCGSSDDCDQLRWRIVDIDCDTSIYVDDGIGLNKGVDIDLELVDLGCDDHLDRSGTCRADISLQIQAHSRRSGENAEQARD